MARTRRQSQFALALADRVKSHVRDNGLTVGKFADACGIARPNVYKLMDGTTTDPSIYLCEQIAEGLGLQVALVPRRRSNRSRSRV